MPMTTLERKIASPTAIYETPTHVLRDEALDRSGKRRILNSMLVEVRLMSEAAAQFGSGSTRIPSMASVKQALADLTRNQGGEARPVAA